MEEGQFYKSCQCSHRVVGMGQAGECVRTHFVCKTGLKCMDDVRTAEVLVYANQIIILLRVKQFQQQRSGLSPNTL